jgi:hypothetical protein
VSFGLKICAEECFLDDYFLNDIKIPIPLCGEFVLPGTVISCGFPAGYLIFFPKKFDPAGYLSVQAI